MGEILSEPGIGDASNPDFAGAMRCHIPLYSGPNG
jgi:hypothetical protein